MELERAKQRIEKQVRLGYNRGKRSYVSVTREHYLREDISCRSELCVLCREIAPPTGSKGANCVCVCVCVSTFSVVISPLRGPKKIIPHS